MKKMILHLTSILVLGFVIPVPAQAWNAVGHKVIAKIAYDNLTPDVRVKVDKMISDLQKEYPEIKNFVDAASWPDQLRTQQNELFTHWHYIDYSFSADSTPVKNLMDTDNAVWAVTLLEKVVQNEQTNPFERARALVFLEHIVGDLHQPLHTVSRISAEHPDGDEGGNLFLLPLTIKKHFGHANGNLHAVWDSGVGAFSIDDNSDSINALAATISGMYPHAYFDKLADDLQLTDWTTEGYNLATTFVYATPENQMPNNDYMEKGKEISKQRAALAGYRLADMLNHLLATR